VRGIHVVIPGEEKRGYGGKDLQKRKLGKIVPGGSALTFGDTQISLKCRTGGRKPQSVLKPARSVYPFRYNTGLRQTQPPGVGVCIMPPRKEQASLKSNGLAIRFILITVRNPGLGLMTHVAANPCAR